MGVTFADVHEARKRLAGTALRTPMVPSPHLGRIAGREFLLKLESTQPIGTFKLRGATNAVMALPESVTGVTCCSTGNHGRGVAYAAKRRGLRAVICMSSRVPPTKVEGIRALGAEARIVGDSQDEALVECRRLSAADGLEEISPFDDPLVIAGQGTIGLEMLESCPELGTVLVPLSGGGLAGGVALAVKSVSPCAKVIGISMERGAAMHASLQAGHPVEIREEATLADSLAGGINADNKLTFGLCRDLLDDIVLVSEEEIYRGMQTLYYEDRVIAEGACAVGVAALQAGKLELGPGPVATIITGRNVDMGMFTRIVTGQDVTVGDFTVEGRRYGE